MVGVVWQNGYLYIAESQVIIVTAASHRLRYNDDICDIIGHWLDSGVVKGHPYGHAVIKLVLLSCGGYKLHCGNRPK